MCLQHIFMTVTKDSAICKTAKLRNRKCFCHPCGYSKMQNFAHGCLFLVSLSCACSTECLYCYFHFMHFIFSSHPYTHAIALSHAHMGCIFFIFEVHAALGLENPHPGLCAWAPASKSL